MRFHVQTTKGGRVRLVAETAAMSAVLAAMEPSEAVALGSELIEAADRASEEGSE